MARIGHTRGALAKGRRAFLIGSALLGASWLSGSGAQAQDSASLEAAAKAEGTLTYYSSQTSGANDAIAKAFTSRYGIEVVTYNAPTSALKTRVQSEIDVGQLEADVVATGEHTLFDANAAAFATISGLPAFAAFPEKYKTEKYFVSAIQTTVLLVNTNLVKSGEINGWKDILDPKWKGTIAMIIPKGSITIASAYNYITEEYGEEFLDRLAAQQPNFQTSSSPAAQLVAAGEAAIAFPIGISVLPALHKANAPVVVVPTVPITGAQITVAVGEKARHPNAARLFANFLLNTEGQTALNGNGLGASPLPGIEGSVPLPEAYQAPDESLSADRIKAISDKLGVP